MAEAVKTGVLYTPAADGDVISGLFPLQAIMFHSTGTSGACVIKANGASGNVIYSATPTNSVITWFLPGGGDPVIFENLVFTTIGSNVTIRAVRGMMEVDVAQRVSVT